MPVIPGTGAVYASNTFLVAPSATFDIDCVEPSGGGELITLREYFAAEATYDLIPVGSGAYEYVSLQSLFVKNRLYAMDTVITTAALPVYGQPDSPWDYTLAGLWLVNEKQLFELMYSNTNVMTWQDLVFTSGIGTVTIDAVQHAIAGFKYVNHFDNADTSNNLGTPVDPVAEGMVCTKLIAISFPGEEVDDIVVNFSTSDGTYLKFGEKIKLLINAVTYELTAESGSEGGVRYIAQDVGNVITDYLILQDGLNVTIGVIGKR